MKPNFKLLPLLVLTLVLLISQQVQATDYYSKSGTTNPSATASWTTSSSGGSGSAPSNFTATSNKFIIRAGQTMTTTSAWTVKSPVVINGTLVIGNSATKTFSSTVNVSSGGVLTINNTAATVEILGDFAVAAGGTFNHYQNYNSGSAILELEGDLSIAGTYSYTGYTPAVWMDGTGTFTINTGTTALCKLLLQKGTFNANGPVTVNDEFYAMWNMNGGSFSTNGYAVTANWGIVNNGGTINVNGGSLTVNGGIGGMLIGRTFTLNGALNVSSGTLTTTGIFLGTVNATPKGTLTQTGGTINAGILDIGNACSYSASGGTLNTTGDMNLGYASSTFSNLIASTTVNIGGSLNNSGAITSVIPANPVITVAGNLNNASTGSITNILGTWPSLNVNGTITNAGTITTVGTTTVSVKGNWVNNGTSTAIGGTVTFSGTADQTIGGTAVTTFNNLVIAPSSGVTVKPQTNNISILNGLTVTSGTFDLGTMSCNRTLAGGTFTVGANATVKLGGSSGGRGNSNFPNNFTSNALDAASSIEYSGGNGVGQDIYGSVTYGNLILSNSTGSGSSTKSLTANVTGIAGNLTVNANTILNLGTYTANRTAAGGTLTLLGNAAMYVSGNTGGQTGSNYPSNFGNSLGAASTVHYNSLSGVNQTVYAATYGNLSLSNATGSGSSIKSLTANITAINGNLSIGANTTFDMATYTANGAGGSLSLASASILKIAGATGGQTGSNFPSGFAAYSLDAAATTEYTGSSAQTIYPVPSPGYGHLTLSAASTKTAGNAISVRGNFLINAGTFAASSYTHNISGNWTNNGIFTPGTSTINFTGTTTGKTITGTITGASSFNNISFNGTGGAWSFGGAVAAIGNFTIANGTVTLPAAGVAIGGDWTNNASFVTGTSTVTFNGGNASQIKGSAASTIFYNLVINKNAANIAVSLKRNISIATDITVTSGIFDQETYTGNRATNGGTFKVAANAVHRVGGNSGGACSNNNYPAGFGTFELNVASTTEYYGTAQSICSTPNYGHLTLSGAGTKTAPATTLVVKGNLTNTGATFIHNNGRVLLNGTNQSFSGMPYYELHLGASGTKTLTSNGSVEEQLALSPTTTLAMALGNNDFTLISTSSKTAYVAEIPSSASFTYGTGRFIAERFMPAKKAWRFVATPVKAGTKIFDTWQEGGTVTAGKGIQITGPGAAPGTNGLDVTSASNSLKYYNPATNSFKMVSNTRTTDLANEKGYMVFVRGDRLATVASGLNNTTVLRTRGELITGTKTYAVPAVGIASVGNPYASRIDLTKVFDNGGIGGVSNVTAAVTIWDPQVGTGANGVGRYRTYSRNNSGDFELTPEGTINNFIESGQAFYVQSHVGGTLTLQENIKVNGSRNAARGSGPLVMRRLRTNLWGPDPDSASALIDGTLTDLDESYSNAFDNMDVRKTANTNENIGITLSGKNLIVERRKPFLATDTIFYTMSGLKQQTYRFVFVPQNLSPLLSGFLEDAYLHTSTPVSMVENTTVFFTVNSVAASAASNRFRMVFKPSAVLPVTITSISANRNSDRSIAINWKVENEINMEKYTVERSADGLYFSGIITTAAASSSASYTKNDLSPLAADNYYRIKAQSIGGRVQYSAIVKVAPEKMNSGISIYPNPVVDKKVQVQFAGQQKGNYQLQLSNKLGQMIWKGNVQVNGSSFVKMITLNENTPSGIYQLKISNDERTAETIQVVIQ